MSKLYVKILKNIVGLNSKGENSTILNTMKDKREEFKSYFNKNKNKINFIEKLKIY